jgi:hypothetical protein
MPVPAELLAKAQAQAAAAQSALDTALAEGADTTEARDRLEAAHAHLRALQLAQDREAASAQAEHAARLQAEAQALVDAATRALYAELTELATLAIPEIALPVSVAAAMIEAREQTTKTETRHREHAERLSALRDRQAALHAEREQIVARRAEGHAEPKDGARLALLAADLEGVARLIGEHEAQAPAPPAGAEHAERLWGDVQADARRTALLVLAKELESRLIETADRLAASTTTWSTAGRYCPDHRLGNAANRGVW